MNMAMQLTPYLKIWQKSAFEKAEESESVHISDATLCRMAEAAGINSADPDTLEHLSFCPQCMNRWAAWCEAVAAIEEEDAEPAPYITYGSLKAASADEKEPLFLRSSCGKFEIGMNPMVDDPERGLITLDLVSEEDTGAFEGRHIQIRDRNDAIILEGTIHQGRMSQHCDNLSVIDLSRWTLIEKN